MVLDILLKLADLVSRTLSLVTAILLFISGGFTFSNVSVLR